MSEVYEMKPLSQVDVQPTPADNAYVLIEQDGEIMRAPKDTIGITDIEPVEPGIGITWLTAIGVSNNYLQLTLGKDSNGDRVFAQDVRDIYNNGIVRVDLSALAEEETISNMLGYNYYSEKFLLNLIPGSPNGGPIVVMPIANNADEEVEQGPV